MNIFSNILVYWIMQDWEVYRQAAQALLEGHNPYLAGVGEMRFMYPVWSLAFVMPFMSLGYPATNYLIFAAYLIVGLLIARKFHFSIWQSAAFLTSATGLMGIGTGNIGFLALIGLLVPAPVAMFFFLIKPQATSVLALVILLREYDQGGWRRAARAVMPAAAALAVFVVMFGIPKPPDMAANAGHNILFPWCLLIGLPAAAYAVWKRSIRWASLSSSFVFPYMTVGGYTTAAVGFPILSWIFSYVFAGLFFAQNGLTYIH